MNLFNIFLIIFNFISIILSFSSSDYSLIFPFNTITLNEIENISLYNDSYTTGVLRNIFENNIFINLKLGSPSQNIKLVININSDDFFIVREDAKFDRKYPKRNGNFYYNQSLSSTFNYQNGKESDIYYSHPHLSNYVQDNFLFISTNNKNDELNVKNFSFLLAIEVKEFEHGVIGLKGIANIKRREDFLTTLKRNNLTNNYIWYLKYNNSTSGNLIIGNYPHDDEFNKQTCNDCLFQKKHFVKIYSNISEYNWKNKWGLNFKKILIKDKNVYQEILSDCEKCHMVEFNPNLGIIKGSKKYEDIIEDSVFNKYMHENLCFKDTITINKNYEDNNYNYYYCNASIYNELKDLFKPIQFEHRLFQTNFSLEYNDLFIKENELIFFKIIFDDYYNWIFGSPFFSKYLFVFNSDTKEIGFYSKNINNMDETDDINSNKTNDYFFIKIIVIIILGIILIVIGIFIGKKIYGTKRKIRINELEDNFEIQ